MTDMEIIVEKLETELGEWSDIRQRLMTLAINGQRRYARQAADLAANISGNITRLEIDLAEAKRLALRLLPQDHPTTE